MRTAVPSDWVRTRWIVATSAAPTPSGGPALAPKSRTVSIAVATPGERSALPSALTARFVAWTVTIEPTMAMPNAAPTWRHVELAPLATPSARSADLGQHDTGQQRAGEAEPDAERGQAGEDVPELDARLDRPDDGDEGDALDQQPGGDDRAEADRAGHPAADLGADDHEQPERQHPQSVALRREVGAVLEEHGQDESRASWPIARICVVSRP